MSDRLATTITLYGVFLALWALLPLLVRRRPGPSFVAGAILLELALCGQAVAAAISWAGGHQPSEPGVFIAYLLASVTLLPAAAAFGSRRTAWDIAIVAVACVGLAVISQRMVAVW